MVLTFSKGADGFSSFTGICKILWEDIYKMECTHLKVLCISLLNIKSAATPKHTCGGARVLNSLSLLSCENKKTSDWAKLFHTSIYRFITTNADAIIILAHLLYHLLKIWRCSDVFCDSCGSSLIGNHEPHVPMYKDRCLRLASRGS